jgi:hypothetical protein
MYYTFDLKRKEVVQLHNKGKDKGYHLTWAMLPMDLLQYINKRALPLDMLSNKSRFRPLFVDEHGSLYCIAEMEVLSDNAASQSFGEGIV